MTGAMIECPACGQETFLRREPVYDGFQRIGETLSCVGCGHAFGSADEVVFVANNRPQVFTDADLTPQVERFAGDEKGRNCRHCKHYVKNPFVQRCGLHQMEVQATDYCEDFEKQPDGAADDPLTKLLGKG